MIVTQGKPGQFIDIQGEQADMEIYAESFGDEGINADVLIQEGQSVRVQVYKDGRRPFELDLVGPVTIAVWVLGSRAREEGDGNE